MDSVVEVHASQNRKDISLEERYEELETGDGNGHNEGQNRAADTERAKKVMWQNASYVFFRELKGAEAGAARGALNSPLTPGRSLAVDTAYHVLGSPIFVRGSDMTHVEKSGTFNRLMIAQDVGSAIKGPERGDIYFGSGAAAGRLAGVTKHAGKFIVLLPKTAPLRTEEGGFGLTTVVKTPR